MKQNITKSTGLSLKRMVAISNKVRRAIEVKDKKGRVILHGTIIRQPEFNVIEGVGLCIERLKNMKGKLLMCSRYRGKGRPRKTDYEQYNSLDERQDLVCTDMLDCGFTANYTQ